MLSKILAALLMLVAIAFTGWAQGGSTESDGIPRITIDELKAKMDKKEKVVVVDVRAHVVSKIEGALHIPYADLEKNLDKLPKDKLLVMVCSCATEATSGRAVQVLKQKGYTQVVALKGGQTAWEIAKYPTEVVKEETPAQ